MRGGGTGTRLALPLGMTNSKAPLHTPLTSALLGAWTHAGTALGERHLQDALRLDTQRLRAKGIPSVGITLDGP